MSITEREVPHTLETESVTINYSREATMTVDEQFYSAFQRNSFNAVVEFEDGERVGVVLPCGACRYGYAAYSIPTVMHALRARQDGRPATVLPEDTQPEEPTA